MAITITRPAFIQLLESKDAGTVIGVHTLTEPKMRKTGNPYYGNCQRLARRNGFIGVEYQNCANNIREREGQERDFVAGPLPWGVRVNRYFNTHNDRIYLKFYPVPGTLEDQWQTLTGQVIPAEEVTPHLVSSGGFCPWRTVALDNILQVNLDGEVYVLSDD